MLSTPGLHLSPSDSHRYLHSEYLLHAALLVSAMRFFFCCEAAGMRKFNEVDCGIICFLANEFGGLGRVPAQTVSGGCSSRLLNLCLSLNRVRDQSHVANRQIFGELGTRWLIQTRAVVRS